MNLIWILNPYKIFLVIVVLLYNNQSLFYTEFRRYCHQYQRRTDGRFNYTILKCQICKEFLYKKLFIKCMLTLLPPPTIPKQNLRMLLNTYSTSYNCDVNRRVIPKHTAKMIWDTFTTNRRFTTRKL